MGGVHFFHTPHRRLIFSTYHSPQYASLNCGARIMFGWFKKIKKQDLTNVEYLPYADIPVSRVINNMLQRDLKSVTVVGWGNDGKLYMASTYAKRGDSYWDLAIMQRELLDR